MTLVRLCLPMLACILSIGCFAKREPEVRYVRVEVPVPVPCPAAKKIERPTLKAPALPPTAPTDERVKALLADFVALLGYSSQLEEALRPYQNQPVPGKK